MGTLVGLSKSAPYFFPVSHLPMLVMSLWSHHLLIVESSWHGMVQALWSVCSSTLKQAPPQVLLKGGCWVSVCNSITGISRHLPKESASFTLSVTICWISTFASGFFWAWFALWETFSLNLCHIKLRLPLYTFSTPFTFLGILPLPCLSGLSSWFMCMSKWLWSLTQSLFVSMITTHHHGDDLVQAEE